MKKSKRFVTGLLAICLMAGMTACSGNSQPSSTAEPGSSAPTSSAAPSEPAASAGEPKEISWATWTVSEEALKPIYMSMVETYMEQHPEVTINVVTYPYAQYKDQLIISAAASNAPDIAHIKKEWMAEFIAQNALQQLDDVLSADLKSDYYENFLTGATIDGKLMAAPWFNNPVALYYNKTLLEKAGISELPSNWKELMEDARKISALGADENGNKIYGYALPNSKSETGLGYNVFPHMWTYGGDFSDKDGNIVINSPENVAAFTEIQQLYQEEISPNGLTLKDARNLFAQGVVGFYYDLEAAVAPIQEATPKGDAFKEEYSTMVIPAMDSPNGYGYTVEHYLAVYNTCDELETIGDLIDHMTGKTVLQILYDGGQGKMPDRSSVAEMEIFKNSDRETTKAYVEALSTAHPLPCDNAAFMQADEAFMDALAQLTISGDPVDKIVADLDARVKELYGQ